MISVLKIEPEFRGLFRGPTQNHKKSQNLD